MKTHTIRSFYNCAVVITLFLVTLASPSWGVLVPPDVILEQLNSAELVADIKIKSLTTVSDPSLSLKTIAVAEILNLQSNRTPIDLRTRDEIEIEFPGGELNNRGVLFSGFPRPYLNVSYKSYLNRLETGEGNRYVITGFEAGFTPLNPIRKFSRNRTDGNNGSGTGPFLFWDSRYFPIPYYISAPSFKNHSDYVTAIEASFKTWRSYDDVKVEFLSLGCNQSTKNENDSLNTIILLTDSWPFKNSGSAIAVTRNFYVSGADANAGMILDSDILLNGKNYKFTTTGENGSHDIQNVVTHEIGHFLSFGHDIGVPLPNQTPEDAGDEKATMYYSAVPGQTEKRTLHANDIAALRDAYSGVGQKFEKENIHCEIPQDNIGCLAVHSNKSNSQNYLALILYLAFTLGIGRWIVSSQKT